jgi:Tfp pilus assembly ATPase PilU
MKARYATMDDCLINLYRQNIISYDDVLAYAVDQDNIMSRQTFEHSRKSKTNRIKLLLFYLSIKI